MIIIKKTFIVLLPALCLLGLSFLTLSQTSISAFSFSTDLGVNQFNARTNNTTPTVHSWPITLNSDFFQLTEGSPFIMPLPSGESISAEVTSRINFENGDVQLISSILSGGSIVMTLGDNIAFGSIDTEEISFSIGLNSERQITLVDNQEMLNELDLSNDMRFPPTVTTEGRAASTARSYEELETLSAAMTFESTIDLLVVYSSEFASLFNAPQTRINQLVSFTNTSFANSGILINIRLVASVQINFDNTNFDSSFSQVFNDLNTTLDDSTNGVGDFSNLPSLRNQYGADLVAVLSANTNNGSAAGLAWVLNSSESSVNGVSTTMLPSSGADAVFAHELGHNLGSVHEIGDCNGGYTGFSCGFRDNNNGWATIMSSGGNTSVIGNLFSNTDNDCLGLTCGLAGSADNRTSFNMSRLVVAEFRDEVMISPPPNTNTPTNSETGWLPAVIFNLISDDN